MLIGRVGSLKNSLTKCATVRGTHIPFKLLVLIKSLVLILMLVSSFAALLKISTGKLKAWKVEMIPTLTGC